MLIWRSLPDRKAGEGRRLLETPDSMERKTAAHLFYGNRRHQHERPGGDSDG